MSLIWRISANRPRSAAISAALFSAIRKRSLSSATVGTLPLSLQRARGCASFRTVAGSSTGRLCAPAPAPRPGPHGNSPVPSGARPSSGWLLGTPVGRTVPPEAEAVPPEAEAGGSARAPGNSECAAGGSGCNIASSNRLQVVHSPARRASAREQSGGLLPSASRVEGVEMRRLESLRATATGSSSRRRKRRGAPH